MLHNLYKVGSFLKYMMPSSCLKTKTPFVNKNIRKRKQPGCFSFFSSSTPPSTARSYSTPPKEPSSLESSNKLIPWVKAFNSLCSFGTKNKSPEDPETPLLTNEKDESLPFPLIPQPLANIHPLNGNIPTPDNPPSSPTIQETPGTKSEQNFVRPLFTFAQDQVKSLVEEINATVGFAGALSGTDYSALQKDIDTNAAVLVEASTRFEQLLNQGTCEISNTLKLLNCGLNESPTSKVQPQHPTQEPPVNSQFTEGSNRPEQSFEGSSESDFVVMSSQPPLDLNPPTHSQRQLPVPIKVEPDNSNSLKLTETPPPESAPVGRLSLDRLAKFEMPKTSNNLPEISDELKEKSLQYILEAVDLSKEYTNVSKEIKIKCFNKTIDSIGKKSQLVTAAIATKRFISLPKINQTRQVLTDNEKILIFDTLNKQLGYKNLSQKVKPTYFDDIVSLSKSSQVVNLIRKELNKMIENENLNKTSNSTPLAHEQNNQQTPLPIIISTAPKSSEESPDEAETPLRNPVLDLQNKNEVNEGSINKEQDPSVAFPRNGPSPLSVIPEETKSNQGASLQEEDAPSSPSRPDLITSNEITDSATKTTDTQAQSPSDFLGFISGGANQFLNDVVSGANETARFASGLMTNITKAPLTRLDLDIVSTTNQKEEDIFEIKAFNFINKELNLYNQIQLLSADKKINCYNLIIYFINKDHKFFNGTITNLERQNMSPSVNTWDQLTSDEMIHLFDQMNRENSIVAGDDDEKVKKLKIIMEILPVYLENKRLNIIELLEEKTWLKLNSITINDELKLKALKYINEVSGSKLDISEADQTNNFDYLMSIIQGKSEEIKKAIYNPHNPRQLASDDSEMDRGSKIHLYDYLNQRLKIYTIDDDDKVQKFNLIARCIKLKRTDALTLVARDGYNEVAKITEASKDELLLTIDEAINGGDDLVSEALKELHDSEAGQIANKIVSEALNSEVVEEASKAIGDINRVAASGVNDVETNAIKAGHAGVIGGLDVLIKLDDAKKYASAALGAVDSTLASGVNEITRALDDEVLPQEENSSITSFNGLSQSNPITDKKNDDSKALENVIVAATQAAHSVASDALSTFDRHVTQPFGALFTGFFPSTSPKPDLSSELSVVLRTSDSPVISDDLKFRAFQYINDVCKIEFKTTEITREENKEFIDFFDYMIGNANDVQRKILQEGTNTTIQPRSYDKSLRQEEKISLFDYLNRNLNLAIITDDKDEKVKRFDAFVNSYSERSNEFMGNFKRIRIEKNKPQVTRENPLRGFWGFRGR